MGYLPRDISYEVLEVQWRPLLERFCSYTERMSGFNSNVHTREDVLQELRIRLERAQKSYDPSRGVKFVTYLWRTCFNRIEQLYRKQNGTQVRIPQHLTCYFPYDDFGLEVFDDHSAIELLYGAPAEVSKLAQLILGGAESREEWTKNGLTEEQIEQGVAGLKNLLEERSQE